MKVTDGAKTRMPARNAVQGAGLATSRATMPLPSRAGTRDPSPAFSLGLRRARNKPASRIKIPRMSRNS